MDNNKAFKPRFYKKNMENYSLIIRLDSEVDSPRAISLTYDPIAEAADQITGYIAGGRDYITGGVERLKNYFTNIIEEFSDMGLVHFNGHPHRRRSGWRKRAKAKAKKKRLKKRRLKSPKM